MQDHYETECNGLQFVEVNGKLQRKDIKEVFHYFFVVFDGQSNYAVMKFFSPLSLNSYTHKYTRTHTNKSKRKQ